MASIVEIAGRTSESSRDLLKVARSLVPAIPKLSTLRAVASKKKPQIINSWCRKVLEIHDDYISVQINSVVECVITALFNPTRIGIESDNEEMLKAIARKTAGKIIVRTKEGEFYEFE